MSHTPIKICRGLAFSRNTLENHEPCCKTAGGRANHNGRGTLERSLNSLGIINELTLHCCFFFEKLDLNLPTRLYPKQAAPLVNSAVDDLKHGFYLCFPKVIIAGAMLLRFLKPNGKSGCFFPAS